jgi:hypothetical protein
MKKYFILLLICLPHQSLFAQLGAKWLTGGGNVIDFRTNPATSYSQCDTFENAWYAEGHSNICDSKGDILFAYTGFIAVKDCENIIENGKYDDNNKWAVSEGGNGVYPQQSIIIPKKDNQYYVFYRGMSNETFDAIDANTTDFHFDMFWNHVVDMNTNDRKGKVIVKDNGLIGGARLSPNSLSAVKHANGRDWWVVQPHMSENLIWEDLIFMLAIGGKVIFRPMVDIMLSLNMVVHLLKLIPLIDVQAK